MPNRKMTAITVSIWPTTATHLSLAFGCRTIGRLAVAGAAASVEAGVPSDAELHGDYNVMLNQVRCTHCAVHDAGIPVTFKLCTQVCCSNPGD